MTVFSLPPITNPQVIVNNSAVTLIEGVTNNSVVLHDFLGFRASGTTNRSDPRNYPFRVISAAQNLVYDRINFRGNIPADMPWEDWYGQTGFTSFNGTCMLHTAPVNSTMNDCVWGIRGDLSSGCTDAVHHKTGNLVVNRPRVWVNRDDFIEIDDANGRTVTINDGFFENQFVWLSGTGNIPNSFYFANNCLVHFRRWPYRPTLINGVFLKVDNASWSPKFRFNNVCMVFSAHNTVDNSRTRSALAQTQATNGCRVLVLGGTFPDRTVITAFQNAGFSVLEDGTGSAATTEWLNRKAAFLEEGVTPGDPPPPPPPPVVVQSLTSPVTISTFVGELPLIEPETVSTTVSSVTTNTTSFAMTTPEWEAGDRITIVATMDYASSAHAGNMTFVMPNGESIQAVQEFYSEGGTAGVEDNLKHCIGVYSFVAAADRAAGTLTANWTFLDSGIFAVIRTRKDTFKVGMDAIQALSVDGSYGSGSVVPSFRTMSNIPEKSRIFAAAGTDGLLTAGYPPAGWTSRVNNRPTTWLQLMVMERNAAATANETVSAANFTTNGAFVFASVGFVILPKNS